MIEKYESYLSLLGLISDYSYISASLKSDSKYDDFNKNMQRSMINYWEERFYMKVGMIVKVSLT